MKMYLRIRLLQRLGLLGPLMRAHGSVDAWASQSPADRTAGPAAAAGALRPARH
jgi:hypothetical protein